jgi:hypothetical protein
VIINKKYYTEPATIIELGLSDHEAQVFSVLFKNHTSVNCRVLKRHFEEDNISEFKCLLNKVSWQEVYLETEVNANFRVFMDSVVYYFNVAFPLKVRHRKKPSRNGWITQGRKMSAKRVRFLNMLKKQPNLSEETNMYIDKYKVLYKEYSVKQNEGQMIRIHYM